jgi:gluconate 2-dehydrogenase gamma chain
MTPMTADHDDAHADRRVFLQRALLLVGATAIAVPVESIEAALAEPVAPALADAVIDTLIPRTDTPGARDAGVPAAFEAMMTNWASAEHRDQFRALLDAIDALARSGGTSFVALAPKARTTVLARFDAAKIDSDSAYQRFKELILTLYYWSEPGATQELRYEAAPGVWEPANKITPETRAWAL